MKIAFIGCGYVAGMYAATLPDHPELELAGAFDTNRANLDSFVARWPCRRYAALDDLLDDSSIEMVLNLTNPRSHFEVNRRALEAGKHVYSEKPLAMTLGEACALVRLAEGRRLRLSSAPCSLLSESAQTLWHALQSSAIGTVRLVYANFDDGMIAPNQSPWNWRDERGVAWPAKDEFEIGCTYEHAGYLLTWLCGFFGPALQVTAFASVQLPEKGISVDRMAPDFSVGCIEFDSGVVARVTCSLVGPKDKSLTVIGDAGTASVGDVRNDTAPVLIRSATATRIEAGLTRRLRPLQRWLERRLPPASIERLVARRYPPVRSATRAVVGTDKRVDFMLGPADLASAIHDQREPLLSARLGAHIVEIIEVLQHPERFGFRKRLTTSFAAMAPAPSRS